MKYYQNPKKHTRSMAVYILLALCLVAVGVAAKNLLSAVSETSENSGNLTSQNTSVHSNVNNIVSNITYSDINSSSLDEQTSSDTTSYKTESDIDVNNPQTNVKKDPVAEYFILPVTGDIIKKFSATELQYSATFNDMRLHQGVDIAAAVDTAVKSAGDGVVISVSNDSSFGTTVAINHGNGIVAYYSGLNPKVLVSANDTVLSGAVIGSVGSVPSESLDQSHLHFAITKDETYVSPLQVLGMEE